MTDLKPGRELDALVAEKIMALPLKGPCDYCKQEFDYVDKSQCPNPNCYADQERHFILPYSTDIAAAWEVFDKILSKQWLARIFRNTINQWVVEDCSHSENGVPQKTEAPTAPHAICLAALKAVGK